MSVAVLRELQALQGTDDEILDALVLRVLAKSPSARFSSARAFREALETIAPEAKAPARRGRRSARAAIAFVALGSALVMLAIGLSEEGRNRA